MIANGTACTSPVSDAALTSSHVGDVGLEQQDLALHDADQQGGADGDAERREPPDEGGGERRQDGDRQHGGVERDDGGEEDGGEGRQPTGDGEVDQLDAVGRPAGARRHPPVLGHGRRDQAEQRAGVDEAQDGGAGEGDADEHQPVEADAEVAPQRHVAGRQQRLGLHDPDPPAQDHERLTGAEQGQGGDELRQPGGVAEEREHAEGHEPEQHPQDEAAGDGDRGRDIVPDVVAVVGGDAAEGAGAEVQDARRPVDEDDGEGDERGQGTRGEAEQHEPQRGLAEQRRRQDHHAPPGPGRAARSGRLRRDATRAGTSRPLAPGDAGTLSVPAVAQARARRADRSEQALRQAWCQTASACWSRTSPGGCA